MLAALQKLLPFLTVSLAVFLECYLIHTANVEAWDEARQGVNALSMHFTGDWWNYNWLGEADTFNTKPPLVVWLTALTYKWLGVSLFSLRLHAIIGTFGTLFFGYRILKLYATDQVNTWLILLLLISGRGLIGFHVGRNGDVDALFICFLMAAIYQFCKYWDFGKTTGVSGFAFFMGLAFLTKSIAIGLVLPGLVAYALWNFDWRKINSFPFLSASFIGLGMLGITYLICRQINVGFPYENGANNLWQAMFLTDGLTRFTDKSFESGYDPFYLFHALDVNFSPYNYLFYGLLIYGLYRFFTSRRLQIPRSCTHGSSTVLNAEQNQPPLLLATNKTTQIKLAQLATCLVLSIFLLLFISTNKHRWYIAPALFWLATLTVLLYEHYLKNYTWRMVVLATISLSISSWRVYETRYYKTEVTNFFTTHAPSLTEAEQVVVPSYLPQHLVYYLYTIVGEQLVIEATKDSIQSILVIPESAAQTGDACIQGYCIH